MSRMLATRRLPNRRLRALPLLAILAFGTPAAAEPLDLTRATCADYVGMGESDRNQLSLWLAGYYAGAAQRPLLDVARTAAAPAELLAICAKSPQLPLIGADTRAPFAVPAP